MILSLLLCLPCWQWLPRAVVAAASAGSPIVAVAPAWPVSPLAHTHLTPPSNPRTMHRLACRMSDVIRRIDSERLVVGRRLSPEGAKSVLREGALSVDLIDGVPVDNVKLPVVAKVRAVPLARGSAAISPHAACWDGPCASAPCGRTAVRS